MTAQPVAPPRVTVQRLPSRIHYAFLKWVFLVVGCLALFVGFLGPAVTQETAGAAIGCFFLILSRIMQAEQYR